MKEHRYILTTTWTGNRGQGTASYRTYDRAHEITAQGKPAIPGSSDPAFRGNPSRWNPEELFVASISACHKLWYLHLCAQAGVVVTAYVDQAEGVMAETPDGAGQFKTVTLRPHVTLAAGSDATKATALHHDAHKMCFIARSVNFEIACAPVVTVAS